MTCRTIYIGTSNAWQMNTKGGDPGTLAAQHWNVVIDGFQIYQSGQGAGLNKAFEPKAPQSSTCGRHRAGVSSKGDEDIKRWVEKWNRTGGGSKPYDLLTNSCQTFAYEFTHWLCDGNCTFPAHAGLRAAAGTDFVAAHVGTGELIALRPCKGVAVTALQAEAGFQASAKGVNAVANATYLQSTLQADTGYKVIDKNLHAGVSALAAGAKADVDPASGTVSASVGAHIAEASAGPFAVRAGAKFGGGIEGGIPVVHAGPVSTACSVM